MNSFLIFQKSILNFQISDHLEITTNVTQEEEEEKVEHSLLAFFIWKEGRKGGTKGEREAGSGKKREGQRKRGGKEGGQKITRCGECNGFSHELYTLSIPFRIKKLPPTLEV